MEYTWDMGLRSTIELVLEGEGVVADWALLRELVDALVVAAGIDRHDILPVSIAHGSLRLKARVRGGVAGRVERLRRGPKTPDALDDASKLYELLDRRSARLHSVRAGKRRQFVAHEPERQAWVAEEGIWPATVIAAGGQSGGAVVEILTERKHMKVRTTVEQAAELGRFLYQRVEASIALERNLRTGATRNPRLIAFEVLGRPLDPVSVAAQFRSTIADPPSLDVLMSERGA